MGAMFSDIEGICKVSVNGEKITIKTPTGLYADIVCKRSICDRVIIDDVTQLNFITHILNVDLGDGEKLFISRDNPEVAYVIGRRNILKALIPITEGHKSVNSLYARRAIHRGFFKSTTEEIYDVFSFKEAPEKVFAYSRQLERVMFTAVVKLAPIEHISPDFLILENSISPKMNTMRLMEGGALKEIKFTLEESK